VPNVSTLASRAWAAREDFSLSGEFAELGWRSPARFLNEEGVTLVTGVQRMVDQLPGSNTIFGLELPEGSALRVALRYVGSVQTGSLWKRSATGPISGAFPTERSCHV
jgi:hypothetical protein